MILDDFFGADFPAVEIKTKATTSELVRYYSNYLLEKIARIFEWKNLPFEQKALEIPTLTRGVSAFVRDPQAGYIIANGNPYGVTWSPLIQTQYVYAQPKTQGGNLYIYPEFENGDAILIQNTSLRTSVFPLINNYAIQLAHADVTIIDSAINMRYDTFLQGDTDADVENLKMWRDKIVEGELTPILSRSLTTAPNVIPTNVTNKGQLFLDAIDGRKQIIRMFFAEIGVRSNNDKRENVINAEVEQNDQMLLFNISDMLKQRKYSARNINARYGLDVDVDLSEEFSVLQKSEFDGDN